MRPDNIKKIRAYRVVLNLDGIMNLRMAWKLRLYRDATFGETQRGSYRISNAIDTRHGFHLLDNVLAHRSVGLLRPGEQHLTSREAEGLDPCVDEAADESSGRDKQSE